MKKDEISALIDTFTCDDVIACQKARRMLVRAGQEGVPYLVKELGNKKFWVRWEAAKALSQIHESSPVEGLVKALRDKALISYTDSVWVREGAHHVLHDMAKRDYEEALSPVLMALEDMEAGIEVPFLAKAALEAIQKGK